MPARHVVQQWAQVVAELERLGQLARRLRLLPRHHLHGQPAAEGHLAQHQHRHQRRVHIEQQGAAGARQVGRRRRQVRQRQQRGAARRQHDARHAVLRREQLAQRQVRAGVPLQARRRGQRRSAVQSEQQVDVRQQHGRRAPAHGCSESRGPGSARGLPSARGPGSARGLPSARGPGSARACRYRSLSYH
ncbi:unnamed protein product [Spodoptera exigua]|nr:unnamed protein product [Spodoptera exigua]